MFKVAVADLPEPEPPLTESIAVGWRTLPSSGVFCCAGRSVFASGQNIGGGSPWVRSGREPEYQSSEEDFPVFPASGI